MHSFSPEVCVDMWLRLHSEDGAVAGEGCGGVGDGVASVAEAFEYLGTR